MIHLSRNYAGAVAASLRARLSAAPVPFKIRRFHKGSVARIMVEIDGHRISKRFSDAEFVTSNLDLESMQKRAEHDAKQIYSFLAWAGARVSKGSGAG